MTASHTRSTTAAVTEAGSIRADAERWCALGVVAAAQFMFVVDAFAVSVALPSIRAGLSAGPGTVAAIIGAYQLAYATLVVTGGRLGDVVGRRQVFVGGVLAFAAASLWCAMAGSALELVSARLVHGATAALMVPQVLATIHALFPDPAGRARAFAIFGVALGLGGAAGFALGGWLVGADPFGLGWRGVFLINVPLAAVVAPAALYLLPRARLRSHGLRLDLLGAVLLFLALAGLVGPVMVGHDLGWPTWLLTATIAGGAVLWFFVRHERVVDRRGGSPLVDPALLANAVFLRGLGAAFAFQFGNVSFYLAMTLFMQADLSISPLHAGLAMVPVALAFTVASQLAGFWAAQGQGIGVLLGGSAVQFAGIFMLGAIAALVPQPTAVALASVLVVFGFGQGLVMAPLSGVVLAVVPPSFAGSGAGLLNTVQQAAGAAGVALVGAVYFWGGAERRLGILAALAMLAASVAATASLIAWMQRAQEDVVGQPSGSR